jgi:hypothetical protein
LYKILLHSIPSHPVKTFLAAFLLCLVGFIVVLWRNSEADKTDRRAAAAAILVTGLFGYPAWFAADRGNLETFVWVFSATGLCLFLARRYRSVALFIGIAGSIKPFA